MEAFFVLSQNNLRVLICASVTLLTSSFIVLTHLIIIECSFSEGLKISIEPSRCVCLAQCYIQAPGMVHEHKFLSVVSAYLVFPLSIYYLTLCHKMSVIVHFFTFKNSTNHICRMLQKVLCTRLELWTNWYIRLLLVQSSGILWFFDFKDMSIILSILNLLQESKFGAPKLHYFRIWWWKHYRIL